MRPRLTTSAASFSLETVPPWRTHPPLRHCAHGLMFRWVFRVEASRARSVQELAGTRVPNRHIDLLLGDVDLPIGRLQRGLSHTSFDTNPKQRCETLGNVRSGDLAYFCYFCNSQRQPETVVRELLIRGSQVRILPGALIKIADLLE